MSLNSAFKPIEFLRFNDRQIRFAKFITFFEHIAQFHEVHESDLVIYETSLKI